MSVLHPTLPVHEFSSPALFLLFVSPRTRVHCHHRYATLNNCRPAVIVSSRVLAASSRPLSLSLSLSLARSFARSQSLFVGNVLFIPLTFSSYYRFHRKLYRVLYPPLTLSRHGQRRALDYVVPRTELTYTRAHLRSSRCLRDNRKELYGGDKRRMLSRPLVPFSRRYDTKVGG